MPHNTQSVKIIQISISRCTVENQNAVELYNGISLSNKKEQSSDTCYNMNEPGKHYVKERS